MEEILRRRVDIFGQNGDGNMKSGNGRAIALLSTAVAVVVLIAGSVVFFRSDSWDIIRLRHVDGPKQREIADRLIERRSVPAIPQLLRAFEGQPDFKGFVKRLLDAFGDDMRAGIPVFAEIVERRPPAPSMTAIDFLSLFAPDDRRAIAALGRALRLPGVEVRRAAAAALAGIGFEAWPALPDLVAALEDQDFDARLEVVRALTGIGPEAEAAFSGLRRSLESDRPELRLHTILALDRIGAGERLDPAELIPLLRHEDRRAREFALRSLGDQGPAARPAVPALVQSLEDPVLHLRTLAYQVMGRIGPGAEEAIPALSERLMPKFRDMTEAQWAAKTLRRIGPKALGALVEALEGGGEYPAQLAAGALGQMGAGARPAVPALARALQSESLRIREAAANALRLLGPVAIEAVPQLVLAAKGADPSTKSRAIGALAKVGPPAVQLLLDVIEGEAGADQGLGRTPRMIAIDCLGGLGPDARPAVPVLIEILEGGNPRLKDDAAEAIGRIGAGATPAIPALLKVVESGNHDLTAAEALFRIDGRTAPYVDCVLRLSAKPTFRNALKRITGVLFEMGPAAKAAAPALAGAIGKDSHYDFAVARTILRLGEGSGPALDALVEKLRAAKTSGEREAILQALALFGPRLRAAVPAMVDLLDDPDASFRPAVALTLARAGEAVVPSLAKLIAQLDQRPSPEVAAALGAMGQAAKEAVPRLHAALDRYDHHPDAANGSTFTAMARAVFRIEGRAEGLVPGLVRRLRYGAGFYVEDATGIERKIYPLRQAAACVLREIGGAAREAVPELRRAVAQEGDHFLRVEAALALLEIGAPAADLAVPLEEILIDRDYRFSGGWSPILDEDEGHLHTPRSSAAVPTLAMCLDDRDFLPYSRGRAGPMPSNPSARLRLAAEVILDRLGARSGGSGR
jgi:HEAT repeat protein